MLRGSMTRRAYLLNASYFGPKWESFRDHLDFTKKATDLPCILRNGEVAQGELLPYYGAWDFTTTGSGVGLIGKYSFEWIDQVSRGRRGWPLDSGRVYINESTDNPLLPFWKSICPVSVRQTDRDRYSRGWLDPFAETEIFNRRHFRAGKFIQTRIPLSGPCWWLDAMYQVADGETIH